MECVIPVGEIYFRYPTRSLMMFEVVREYSRMLKSVRGLYLMNIHQGKNVFPAFKCTTMHLVK